jgi:hypothetical protein
MIVDRYIAGLNGKMDFMGWNWDDELKQILDCSRHWHCSRINLKALVENELGSLHCTVRSV